MAETVQFDLVSPERLLASLTAEEVQIPGAEGDLTAMVDHAALITTLRPGIVRVSGPQGPREFVVTGGFAEISGKSVSVLAERAVAREEMTQAEFKAMVDAATDRLAYAQEAFANQPGSVDEAAKQLADMVAVGDQIGLSAT